MKTLLILMASTMALAIVTLVHVHDELRHGAAHRAAAGLVLPRDAGTRPGDADRDLFKRTRLEDLILLDEAGYAALPEGDRGRFLRWVHLTEHAMFLRITGREYAYCANPERHL